MVVGVLQAEVIVHDASSLKDKRRVIRSIKDRLHREHQVSVAEVGALDALNVGIIGIAQIGGDGKRVAQVLDRITEKLRLSTDWEIGAVRREMVVGRETEPDGDAEQACPEDDALAREMLARAGTMTAERRSDGDGR